MTTNRSSDRYQDREPLKPSPGNSFLSMWDGSRMCAPSVAGGLRETVNIPCELADRRDDDDESRVATSNYSAEVETSVTAKCYRA